MDPLSIPDPTSATCAGNPKAKKKRFPHRDPQPMARHTHTRRPRSTPQLEEDQRHQLQLRKNGEDIESQLSAASKQDKRARGRPTKRRPSTKSVRTKQALKRASAAIVVAEESRTEKPTQPKGRNIHRVPDEQLRRTGIIMQLVSGQSATKEGSE